MECVTIDCQAGFDDLRVNAELQWMALKLLCQNEQWTYAL